MSTLSQFFSGSGERIPTSLVREAGTIWTQLATQAGFAACVATASGAMTANTLKTALNLSGKGQLNYLAVWNATAVSRTIRIKITLDGTVIYDKTGPASATASAGHLAVGVGHSTSSAAPVGFQPLRWATSLLVEVANSLSETDGITYGWNYETHAA